MHWHVPRNLQVSATSGIAAADVWSYRRKGKQRRSRVAVMLPEKDPTDRNGDWRCGVFVEGLMKEPTYAMGVGPVDALMNASRLLISLWDELGGAEPRAAEPRRRRTKPQRD
jgi:hypothetical protein